MVSGLGTEGPNIVKREFFFFFTVFGPSVGLRRRIAGIPGWPAAICHFMMDAAGAASRAIYDVSRQNVWKTSLKLAGDRSSG